MATVNISSENMKLVKDYAKKTGMSATDCVNHFLPRGIKRDIALQKHRKLSGAPPKKKAAKKTAKRAAGKKTSGKVSGKKAGNKKANGKAGKVTDAALRKMKKDGMSNPQISKVTGLSKDQVFRRLKR